MTEDQKEGLKQSAMSMFIAYFNATNDEQIDKRLPDDRAMVEAAFDLAVGSMVFDHDSWARSEKSRKMLYDIYLEMRTSEGTVTDIDLTRRGLTMAMFSSNKEYYEHMQRVSQAKAEDLGDGTETLKVCTMCNRELPRSKFKKKGGSKCNACMCAEYKKRKAAR